MRNPFRTKVMRDCFDYSTKMFETRSSVLFNKDGSRARGNGFARHFWNGYDGNDINYSGMTNTPAYAMYKAGLAVRKEKESNDTNKLHRSRTTL